MTKPELLCPAGSEEALHAAVLGGADAVYFGGEGFNARANAKNFGEDAVVRAVSFCHERGVKTYVTLNTLLTDRQLPRALDFAAFLYRAGVDALIVADLGLARILHVTMPDFPLHASTQASGHHANAAALFRSLGFSRMVCAREMNKEDVRELCRTSPIPIEMFVHGAICASHSGQCLMSSMIGDRSGNRGECAQPCRLPYNGKTPLSFRDLCLAGHMKEILSLGVASLKIEGRMKSPQYVYTVARTYRRLLDEERDATPAEIERLRAAFSRSGFTDGYFTGKKDGSMLGVRREEDKALSRTVRDDFRDCGVRRAPIVLQREPVEPAMPPLPEKTALPEDVSYRFTRPEQIPRELEGELCFLPLDMYRPGVRGVVLPPVVFPREEAAVRAALQRARDNGAEVLLVTNPGGIALADGMGFVLYGDFRLNITNSFSPLAQGFSDLQLSPELNLAQMRDLALPKSVLVYGRLPLMLLEKRVGFNQLRDRRGVVFPVIREGKRDLVLNSVPFYMGDKKKDLQKAGLKRFQLFFTTETPSQVRQILTAWQEGAPLPGPVRRIK